MSIYIYWNVYVVSDDVTQIVYYRMLMTFGLQKEKEGESESYIYIYFALRFYNPPTASACKIVGKSSFRGHFPENQLTAPQRIGNAPSNYHVPPLPGGRDYDDVPKFHATGDPKVAACTDCVHGR